MLIYSIDLLSTDEDTIKQYKQNSNLIFISYSDALDWIKNVYICDENIYDGFIITLKNYYNGMTFKDWMECEVITKSKLLYIINKNNSNGIDFVKQILCEIKYSEYNWYFDSKGELLKSSFDGTGMENFDCFMNMNIKNPNPNNFKIGDIVKYKTQPDIPFIITKLPNKEELIGCFHIKSITNESIYYHLDNNPIFCDELSLYK